jgi:hypothetical protein
MPLCSTSNDWELWRPGPWKARPASNRDRMRFLDPKQDTREQWHRWFAWRPVRLRSGNGRFGPVVWLEWIERRLEFFAGFGGIHEVRYYRDVRH